MRPGFFAIRVLHVVTLHALINSYDVSPMRSVIFFEASAPASEAILLRRGVGIMQVGIIGECVGVDGVDEKDESTSSVLSVDEGRG